MYTMVGAWSNNEEVITSLGLGNILKSLVEFALERNPMGEMIGPVRSMSGNISSIERQLDTHGRLIRDSQMTCILFCCFVVTSQYTQKKTTIYIYIHMLIALFCRLVYVLPADHRSKYW